MLSHRNPRCVETLATVGRTSDRRRSAEDGQNSPYFYGSYMQPDENDTMEVLADCLKHFTRQDRAAIGTVAAPCPEACHLKPRPKRKPRNDAARERDKLRKRALRAQLRAAA